MVCWFVGFLFLCRGSKWLKQKTWFSEIASWTLKHVFVIKDMFTEKRSGEENEFSIQPHVQYNSCLCTLCFLF